jgi:hypothetical protein
VSASGERGSTPSDNGPRVNLYTLDQGVTAHDTGIQVATEPDFDNASWIPYAGVDLVEFGHWELAEAEDHWIWFADEPGQYTIISQLQITLDGNANVNTRVGVGNSINPETLFASEPLVWTPAQTASDSLIGAARNSFFISQNQIDAGQNFVEISGRWRRGGSEACTDVDWYFNIFKNDPGASYDQWPDF